MPLYIKETIKIRAIKAALKMENTSQDIDNNSSKLDPLIIEKIQKILVSITRGNGAKKEEVHFKNFDGETITLQANTLITLTPIVSKKITAGKTNLGTLVGDEHELDTAIKNSSEEILKDEVVSKKIKGIILERDDRGFAIKGMKQKIEAIKKQYCLHMPCQNCHASGKMNCQHCRATGRMSCQSCRGNRLTQCIHCNGSGKTATPNGRTQCFKCMGQGRINCMVCKAQGYTRCTNCNAVGTTGCQQCNSNGWMTQSTLIEQEAIFMFHVNLNEDQQAFSGLAKHIEQNGTDMLLKNDLKVDILKSNNDDEQSDEQQLSINYSFSLPYGDITFDIKNMPITAKLIGYRGKLMDIPPFLEILLKKPMLSLKKAATSPSPQTISFLEKACKARMIREVIKLSAERSQKNAIKELKNSYPYGIKEKTFKSLIKMSRKSFLDLTRGGRYKGLAFGLIAATIISALYYFILRVQILPSVPQNQTTITTIDIVAFAIGLVCNLLVVQAIGKKHLFKNLSYLLHQNIKVRASQIKTGKAWIWSIIGNIAVFIGLSWLALSMGYITAPPIWLNL